MNPAESKFWGSLNAPIQRLQAECPSPSLHILKSVWEPKLKSRPCIPLRFMHTVAASNSLKPFLFPHQKIDLGTVNGCKKPKLEDRVKAMEQACQVPNLFRFQYIQYTGFQLHFWLFPGLCFYVQNRMPSAAHVETSKVMDIDENDLMQLFSMIDPRLIAAELCVFFLLTVVV